MKKFKVKIKDEKKRLDKFLNENIPEYSRNKIQKLIKNEDVKINKTIVSSSKKLKKDDIITISEKKEIIAKKLLEIKEPKILIKKIKIIEDNPEYLIINKPAGISVHGASHMTEYTIADWLLREHPEIKKVGEDPFRPGIVHRLDKNVSGIMVIAKNQESFENIKKQFISRKTKKEYTALVYGKIEREEGEINFPIKRSASGHKMAALPFFNRKEKNELGRNAITTFKIIKRFINYTLLKVKIKTGRTHQIRTHLFAFGHPIVGDDLYNTKKTREKNKKVDLNRIFLFADSLSFYNLSKKEVKYETKMPNDLKEFFKEIK